MDQARIIATVQNIKAAVKAKTPPGSLPYKIEHICEVVEAATDIDRLVIEGVPVEENHIWGRYRRFEQSAAVYGNEETIVIVEYSTQLDDSWRRFVVCKELCQALLHDSETQADSRDKIIKLINELRVSPADYDDIDFSPPSDSERIALLSALEILCPLEDREAILDRCSTKNIQPDHKELALAFHIPLTVVTPIFQRAYNSMTRMAFNIPAPASQVRC